MRAQNSRERLNIHQRQCVYGFLLHPPSAPRYTHTEKKVAEGADRQAELGKENPMVKTALCKSLWDAQ